MSAGIMGQLNASDRAGFRAVVEVPELDATYHVVGVNPGGQLTPPASFADNAPGWRRPDTTRNAHGVALPTDELRLTLAEVDALLTAYPNGPLHGKLTSLRALMRAHPDETIDEGGNPTADALVGESGMLIEGKSK